MKNGELSLYHVLKHCTLKFQHYMHFWTRTVWQTQDKLHEFIVVFNRNLVAYTNLSRFIVINWIILNGFEYFDLNTFSHFIIMMIVWWILIKITIVFLLRKHSQFCTKDHFGNGSADMTQQQKGKLFRSLHSATSKYIVVGRERGTWF